MAFLNEKGFPIDAEEQTLINKNYHQSFSSNIHQVAKPNFSRVELKTVEFPNQIAKEIRSEKLRLFNVIFLNFLFFATGLFFCLVYFLAPIVDDTQLKIPIKYIPHPAFSIILAVIGLIFCTIGIVDQFNLKVDLRSYKTDLLMKIEKIPYFLIKNYKKLLVRPIYLNWLSFSTYICSGIVIGVFYLIRVLTKNHNQFGTEIIIMLSIIGLMLIVQVITLIGTYRRKGRITSYYGYEIVPFDEAKTLKKSANRRCLVLFLILMTIIFFAIMVPYFILRRKNKQGVMPRI